MGQCFRHQTQHPAQENETTPKLTILDNDPEPRTLQREDAATSDIEVNGESRKAVALLEVTKHRPDEPLYASLTEVAAKYQSAVVPVCPIILQQLPTDESLPPPVPPKTFELYAIPHRQASFCQGSVVQVPLTLGPCGLQVWQHMKDDGVQRAHSPKKRRKLHSLKTAHVHHTAGGDCCSHCNTRSSGYRYGKSSVLHYSETMAFHISVLLQSHRELREQVASLQDALSKAPARCHCVGLSENLLAALKSLEKNLCDAVEKRTIEVTAEP